MKDNKIYRQVRRWTYRNARPLDLARWQYHFEGGSAEAVVRALEAYQNNDGGFGHGLEADCWNPISAPLQTWWAIQFLKEVDMTGSSHPMIQGILRYLASGDGMANGHWLFSVASNNDYPRAPWWSYDGKEAENHYNPTAALAGFVVLHADGGDPLYNVGCDLVKASVDDFMARESLTDMHELNCFIELYEDLLKLDAVPWIDMEAFAMRLRQEVKGSIEYDSAMWATTYCCKPSHFITHPDSFLYEGNEKIMDDELNLIQEALDSEEVWPITWAWGGYEKAFAISENWWKGHLAVMHMRRLRDFGRL